VRGDAHVLPSSVHVKYGAQHGPRMKR